MNWLNAALFLLLIAGHCELQVALLNRLYARRLACGPLRRLRHVHELLIPLFPVLLVTLLGFGGPGLLRGGSWSDVSPGWRGVLLLCAGGTSGLCVSVLRWHWPRRVPWLAGNHSRVIDLAARLGKPPLNPAGRYRRLASFPGNEIFQVEFNEKKLRHPCWPAAWNGLSILHLSDLHFEGTIERSFFREVMALVREQPAHLIVFTGDLLDRQKRTDWLPDTLGTLSASLGCFFVLGNHDWYLQPDDIRAAVTALGWRETAGRITEISDVQIRTVLHRPILPASPAAQNATEQKPAERPVAPRLLIGGDERPWMGNAPPFPPVQGQRKSVPLPVPLAESSAADGTPDKESGEDFRLLLSHTPDNLPWAKAHGVHLMLSGHNHGGQVVLPFIGPVYSPSRYGVKYAGGLFWEEPTLLSVSRGLSGRHPLRYRCRPEVTRLVLECGTENTTDSQSRRDDSRTG